MKRARINPVLLSTIIFIFAQALLFITVTQGSIFLKKEQIYIPPQPPPDVVVIWPTPAPPPTPGVEQPPQPPEWTAVGPILIYFAAVIVVLGLILFFIPIRLLKAFMRVLFAFLFAWGIFIVLVFWLPLVATIIISAGIGLVWFLVPRVWLHNLIMVLTMVAVGAVFGRFIPPWTSMVVLGALAVYDLLAVRFGFMLFLAKKLSDLDALPAFVLPRYGSEWNASLRSSNVTKIVDTKPSEREFSILGGGDLGFPLLLVSSTYFGYGLTSALIISGFSIVGLIAAYGIQLFFLKGKPVPGLPPIAVMCLLGLIIVRFVYL